MTGAPVAGLAAGFLEQANVRDGHRAVHGFRHVIDRQQRDRDGGQRLHLDAGLAVCRGQRGGGDAAIVEREVERHAGEGQRVAERDKVGGLLRRHDPGDARDGEHVTLLRRTIADRGERVGGDGDAAGGDCPPLRHRLVADIDHMRGAIGVEMREAAQPTSARVAASMSSARISASPIRKQCTPCSAIASRSARVSSPLSATKVQSFGALPTSL